MTDVNRAVAGTLFAVAMIAIIVTVDLVFFRDHPWARLAANVGIVLVFVASYLGFASSRR